MKTAHLPLAVVAFLAPMLRADHQAFVVISVNASKAYTRQKIVNGSPRPETYLFYRGKFFPGTPDPSIERMSFDDITQALAPNLAKQNYQPTTDKKAADLLIIVNWGTTLTEPGSEKTDAERLFQFDTLMSTVRSYNSAWAAYTGNQDGALALPPDTSDITANLMVRQNDEQSAQSYAGMNARLLGYTAILAKAEAQSWVHPDGGVSAAVETRLSELNQERYFVILLAYDYQKILRDRAAKGLPPARPKPVWSLRMNMQADGNNFRQALPEMSQVAADYFGKQLDDLQTLRVSVGSTKSSVHIGETKVLDEGK